MVLIYVWFLSSFVLLKNFQMFYFFAEEDFFVENWIFTGFEITLEEVYL